MKSNSVNVGNWTVVVLFLGVLSITSSNAQAIGDYRSNVTTGAWSTLATWQRLNALPASTPANWATPTAGQGYPGQNITGTLSTTVVTIQNSHSISLDASLTQNIAGLVIGGGTSGTLTVGVAANTTTTLTCTGPVSISTGGSLLSIIDTDGTHTLNFQNTLVNNGTINFAAGSEQVTLNVTSTTNNSGSITFGTNTGVKTFTGAVTNSGSWDSNTLSTTSNLIFKGGVSSSGTFAAGGATFNVTQSIAGTGPMSFSGIVTVTGVAVTLTNSNTNSTSGLTLSNTSAGALTGTGGFAQSANSILNYAGQSITLGVLGFSANASGNIVNYTGTAGTVAVLATTYYDLTYSGSVAGTISALTSIQDDLLVNGSGTLSVASGLTVPDNLTISGAGILNINALVTLTVNGNFIMDGTSQLTGANATTSILNVSTGTFSVNASATNARIGGATGVKVTIGGTSSIAGTLVLNIDAGVKTFVGKVTNTGSWTSSIVATSNLVFRGGISSSGTFVGGGATFDTNAQALQGIGAMSFSGVVTVTTITLTNSNTNNVSGVTLSNTGTGVLTGTGTFAQDINSILTYAGQTITLGAGKLIATATGNIVNYTGTAGTVTVFPASYYDLTYSGSVAGTINASTAVGDDLLVNGSGTLSIASGLTVTDDLTISGAGILNINTGTTATVNGDFTMDGTSQLTGATATSVLTVSTGTFSVPVSATNARMGSLTVTIGSTSNIAGTFTINSDTGVKTFTGALTSPGSWTSTAVITVGNLIFGSDVTSSVTAFATNSATFKGNLTVSSGSFTSSGTTTFNGAANQTLSGAVTYTFNNLTLNTTSSANVLITKSITINGILNFAANGLLVVDANSDVTLGNAASITNPNTSRYIQLDGGTGAASQLIKTSTAAATSWQILFPIGTSTGGYTPVDLTGTTMTAPASGNKLSVKAIYNNSIQGQLRRTFRLISDAAGTTFSGGKFYINSTSDVSTGDALVNYTVYWYLNASTGAWSSTYLTGSTTVSGGGNFPANPPGYFFTATTATQPLSTGTYYYSLGVATAYPNTWYSYQTGNWNNYQNWTLDPSGTTLVNPLNLPPQSGDEIIILNGITITNDVNGQITSSVTIQAGGVLDMGATTGNNLVSVNGAGLFRVQGVGLPTAGTNYAGYAGITTAGTGGTIEYYNTTGTLPASLTSYNKLILSNSSASAVVFSTANNLTVNNDFNITQTGGGGTVTWRINDGSAARRTISLKGNVTVSASALIKTSTSGLTSPHSLTMYGNLTNNGTIKFFDDTDTDFDDVATDYTAGTVFALTSTQVNTVEVTFSGTSDQTVTCNNTTDFYRLILDKGFGQQAMLTVSSTNVANFRLWGPNSMNTGGSPTYSNCALSIKNGTLQLAGTMTIPSLIENGMATVPNDIFPIPSTGALWLNGSGVNVTLTSNETAANDDQRLTVNGLFKVTNGTFNAGYSRGIGSGAGGTLQIEGGVVNAWQYRPISGGLLVVAYVHTGGIFNVGTVVADAITGATALTGISDAANGVTNQFARFSLPSGSSSFSMSGTAVLNIGTPTQGYVSGANVPLAGGLDIQSSSSNYNVSGGTINAYSPTSGAYAFDIYSNAPFYNLNLRSTAGTTPTFELNSDLIIQNNLTLITGTAATTVPTAAPTLNCLTKNLTVGGNLDIQAFTVLTPGPTITFNGSGAQSWSNNGTVSAFNALVVNKSAGTLTLSGSTAFNATALTLTSGTLNDGGKTITVSGAIGNSATHTGTGNITVTGTGARTLTGANGTFGNLIINSTTNGATFTVSTAGAQTVSGNLQLNGTSATALTTLSIGSYGLTVLGNITTNQTPASNYRIQTAGLRNDDGLTRKAVTNATDLVFPVGVSGNTYTPITINVGVTSGTLGYITVRPVAATHPNVTQTGYSLAYYWRVTSIGFTNITTVTHKDYTYGSALKPAASGSNYQMARYEPSTFKWSYYNTTFNPSGTTITNTTANPWVVSNATNTGWTGEAPAGAKLDGEFTAGIAPPATNNAFGTVMVYYSYANNGNWGTAATWSNNAARSSVSSTTPCSTCPVVISLGHTININASTTLCGSLQIASGSTLDCKNFTGLNFGTSTGEVVTGTGTLKIDITSGVFPLGDFSSFIDANGGTVEWYSNATPTSATTYIIPNTGLLSSGIYNNLVINPGHVNHTITFPQLTTLTVYGTLTKNGPGKASNNSLAGTANVNIKGDFLVNAGSFVHQAAVIVNFAVTGNTTIASGATLGVQGGSITHTYSTTGNITNNGTLDFRNGSAVDLTVTGTSNTSLSGTASAANTTRLNNLYLNKGTSSTPVFTIDVTGSSMSTLTAGGWLTLTNGNGTINFNNSATYKLSSTAAAFTIPTTVKIKVQAGTVTILDGASSNNADLTLNGALEVAGGTVNIGTTSTAFNNDIEYASAGVPSITVSSGTLFVNGAIRRSTSTLSGALSYTQTGGTVTVAGQNCTANNTRGVFEIEDNAGSNFTFTGGTLNIQRPTGGSTFADFYLNPVTSSVTSSGIVYLGISGNVVGTANTIDINSAPALGSMLVYEYTTANMVSSALSTSGTLTLNANATMVTNALNVNIGGNFTVTTGSTYTGLTSTTTFNGSGTQAANLSGTANFLNITVNKSGSSTLNLTGNSPSVTNLNLLNGVIDVGNLLTINVSGDIVNNASQTGLGKIVTTGTGTTHSITSSGGSFTNLTLGIVDATAKKVTVTGNLTINGTLDFTTGTGSRYLFIQSNKLTFGTAAVINNAGASKFIRTNGVSSDGGVLKNFVVGTPQSFTFAVGTRTNYTPAIFSNLNVTGAGALTVVPVDEQHPTASALGDKILNYYWIVSHGTGLAYANSGSPSAATHVYQFPAGLFGGSTGTALAAYLNAVTAVGWITSVSTPTSDASGTLNSPTAPTTLTYTNSLNTNLPLTGGTFHYSIGTNTSLPPVIQPAYSRFSDANLSNATTVNDLNTGAKWDIVTSWTLATDGKGAALGGLPTGRPVVILSGARVNMDVLGQRAFSTKIDGLLVVTTSGHNLGTISGTGTLRTSSSTLPAGTYTAFTNAGGGTIEYIAPVALNSRDTYNNLSIYSGSTGSVTMTATNLTINGNVTVPLGTTLDNTSNSASMAVGGNWSNSGTFNAGTGAVTLTGNMTNSGTFNAGSTLSVGGNWSNTGTFNAGTGTTTFNGSAGQSTTGATTFNNLTINKTNNLTLGATTTVNGVLTLIAGNIISNTYPTTPLFIMGASSTLSGGSSSSFVSGQIQKTMNSGTTFTFPVGSNSPSRYRPAVVSSTSATDQWNVSYIPSDPTTGGYSSSAFNSANMAKVSKYEYWQVTNVSGTTTAGLSLSFGAGSYGGTDIGILSALKTARWNGTQWDVPPGAGTFSQSGNNVTGSVSVSFQSAFSPQTVASTDGASTLPIVLISFNAQRTGEAVQLIWKTAQEINNDHFEIERSADGIHFKTIGTMEGAGNSSTLKEYLYIDKEILSTVLYYRILQVDFDKKSSYSSVVKVEPMAGQKQQWAVYPNPVSESQLVQLRKTNTDAENLSVEVILLASDARMLYKTSGTVAEINKVLPQAMNTYPAGLYILQVYEGLESSLIKIVKK